VSVDSNGLRQTTEWSQTVHVLTTAVAAFFAQVLERIVAEEAIVGLATKHPRVRAVFEGIARERVVDAGETQARPSVHALEQPHPRDVVAVDECAARSQCLLIAGAHPHCVAASVADAGAAQSGRGHVLHRNCDASMVPRNEVVQCNVSAICHYEPNAGCVLDVKPLQRNI